MFLGTELNVFSRTAASHQTQPSHLFHGTTCSRSSGTNSNSYHGHLLAAAAATATDPSVDHTAFQACLVEHDYHLAAEGDLFKAPEPVVEEPAAAPIDSMTAALSMMSGGSLVAGGVDDALAVADIGPIGSTQLLDEFLYECENDVVVVPPKLGNGEELPEPSVATPRERKEEEEGEAVAVDGAMQKSVSSGRLNSMDRRKVRPPTPNFLGFEEAAIGLRRARSDSDIQTLGNGSGATVVTQNVLHPSPVHAINKFKSKERRQKLSRYRDKRERRNFGRKIKYACRKALAENQLRVRGRFAKIEDPEISKPV